MIETVVAVNLPVDETMRIKKNRLTPDQITGEEKRLAIVTGLHGDEVGGQYICYEVIRRIKADYANLHGIVDVYPSLNPLGLDTAQRQNPFGDIDMNTCFPGNTNGSISEYVASQIMEDIKGADVCIDVHSSSIFLRETLQVRMNNTDVDALLPIANTLNTSLVWVHPSSTVNEGSLAFSLNELGVKTMVVEEGVALQVDHNACNRLIEGLFALMKQMGIWTGESKKTHCPVLVNDENIEYINCETSGTFFAEVPHGSFVKKGDTIGHIVKVITGGLEEVLVAPCDGMIFSLRAYPIVEEGSLIARIVKITSEERNRIMADQDLVSGGFTDED